MAYTREIHRETVVTHPVAEATTVQAGGITVARALYYILEVVEALLVVRLALRLLGANAGNDLVALLYNMTAPLIAPFQGIFASASLGGGSVLEWASVLAMIAYALIAYAIVHLIRLMTTPANQTTTVVDE